MNKKVLKVPGIEQKVTELLFSISVTMSTCESCLLIVLQVYIRFGGG